MQKLHLKRTADWNLNMYEYEYDYMLFFILAETRYIKKPISDERQLLLEL